MMISFIFPHFLWFLLLVPLTVMLALYGRSGTTGRRFWFSMVMRCLLLLLVVMALAGLQLHLPSDLFTAVFVIDYSDSITSLEQARAEELVRQAVSEMPQGDQAAIVIFGEDALVERLASDEQSLQDLTSIPISTRTDIQSALQLAMALFPDEGAKRLVLLSDGRENVNQAVKQAEMAAMQNVELVYIPLGDQNQESEVRLDALDVPADLYYGQDFNIEASIVSSGMTQAELQIYADGELIDSREVELQTGTNRFSVAVENAEAGFHRYRAIVVADHDTKLQNNEASAFSRIQGPANMLVVEGKQGEGENLIRALIAGEIQVERSAPGTMPTTLEDMANYDAVVLVNVLLSDIPAGARQVLPVFVRDLGHGLLVVGGEQAYGAGGYLRSELEEILPVSMEVSSQEREQNLALVLAVDKSGSMGRCHCDSSDLNQSYTRQEVGQPKVDIAKEAIMRSANALGSQDYLGVVGFDDQAHWAYEVSTLPEQSDLENSIGAISANGQTNMQAGMQAAYDALAGIEAGRKHVIMLTDGWTNSGDISGLVHKMNNEGITVSLVAAGGGSADYLRSLADAGGGRYYAAQDMLSVPDIFLKETVESVGEYIIEEPFYPLPGNPSSILRGLDETLLPPLLGYNGTTVKNAARLDLLTARGDPLLASWQYGLGKSAVWTSDFKGQWATDWIQWDEFTRFSTQLAGWLLPVAETEGLAAQAEITGEGVYLSLDAQDEQGHRLNNLTVTARVITPSLEVEELALNQSGAGHYELLEQLDQQGTYMVTMNVMDGIVPVGQTTFGMVVPYSPEYRASGLNLAFLEQLTAITGGGQVLQMGQVFQHNLVSQSKSSDIWHPLLMIVALLFPLDVAIRRLSLTQRDWMEFIERFKGPFQRSSTMVAEGRTKVFGTLFEARQRVRQQQDTKIDEKDERTTRDEVLIIDPIDEKPSTRQAQSSEDAMQRLKAAKKRARDKQ